MVRFHQPFVYKRIEAFLINRGCKEIKFEERVLNCFPDGIGFASKGCYFVEYESRMLTKSVRTKMKKYTEIINKLNIKASKVIMILPMPKRAWGRKLYRETFEKKYPFLELIWKEELKC